MKQFYPSQNFYLFINPEFSDSILLLIILASIFVFAFLLYKQLKISNYELSLFNKKISLQSVEENRKYFLYLALLFFISDFIYTYFNLGIVLKHYSGNFVALYCLFLYSFTSFQKTLKYTNGLLIFSFAVFWLLIVYNLFTIPIHFILFSKYILILFFSTFFIKKFKYYLFFIGINFTLLFILLSYKINENSIIVLINTVFITLLIHLSQFIRYTQNHKNLLFTQDIINNTNSIIIATDNLGNVKYCNDSITKILGYSTEEVLGKAFWELTQDKDFTETDYNRKFVPNAVCFRKLKCKNGEFKYIQWTDFKHTNNLFVATGQDVTSKINLERKYANLIQNAKDIIYECDRSGKITYANKFAIKTLGYSIDEIIGQNYIFFTRKDYKKSVLNFYINNATETNEYDLFEFPIIRKNGDEIWVSQKVSIKKDENDQITGYSCIMRDITLSKSIEIEEQKRRIEISRLNAVSNRLSTLNFHHFDNLQSLFEHICKETAIGLNIDRVSIWENTEEKITLENIYVQHEDKHYADLTLNKNDFKNYFQAIAKDPLVIASDVYQNNDLIDFAHEYFPKYNIKSLLDIPILHFGKT